MKEGWRRRDREGGMAKEGWRGRAKEKEGGDGGMRDGRV